MTIKETFRKGFGTIPLLFWLGVVLIITALFLGGTSLAVKTAINFLIGFIVGFLFKLVLGKVKNKIK